MMQRLKGSSRSQLSCAACLAVAAGGAGLVTAPAVVLAREYEAQVKVESLEDLYEMQHSGDLEDDTVETLAALLQRPMNINRADRYVLYDLPQVTFELADAIIAFRAEKGPFASIDDLAQVPGMTPRILAEITPFVTVGGSDKVAGEASKRVAGTAELGSIWRRGFNKDADTIDPVVERQTDLPQSYLRLTGTGFTYLGAGLLATVRRRTNGYWDYSRGYLVSKGPSDQLDLDDIYVHGGYGPYSVIFGSYRVGFGERLVFDSSGRRFPEGWYENDAIYEDKEAGKLRPHMGQFGAAASVKGAEIGNAWLDATVFISNTYDDLYQYRMNYGFDRFYGGNTCQTSSDCPDGYSCGPDKTCYSSRIADAKDPTGKPYQYETLKDAYEERLGGANVTVNFSERSRVGATGYLAHTDFRLATEAHPQFSYSAGFPRKHSFGAYGVNGAWGQGFVELSGEVARTGSGGTGAYLRSVIEPSSLVEIEAALRYYDRDFDNPHSKGEAAPDTLFYNRSRDEQGFRTDITVRPLSGLVLVTHFDIWERPYWPVFSSTGALHYKSYPAAQSSKLSVSERADYDLTGAEDLSLLLDYRNNDLEHNGRGLPYDVYYVCDPGAEDLLAANGITCGGGERRKFELKVGSSRIPRTHAWMSYTGAWQGVKKYAYRYDYESRIRLHAAVDAWPGGHVVGHISGYTHKIDVSSLTAASLARYDGDPRGDPFLEVYLEVRQKLHDMFTIWLRYGVLRYKGNDPARYQDYHLLKADLEAKF